MSIFVFQSASKQHRLCPTLKLQQSFSMQAHSSKKLVLVALIGASFLVSSLIPAVFADEPNALVDDHTDQPAQVEQDVTQSVEENLEQKEKPTTVKPKLHRKDETYHNTFTLEQVCTNQKVIINRISQMKKIFTDVKNDLAGICTEFIEAINGLYSIIEGYETGSFCNMRFITNVRNFHNNHIRIAGITGQTSKQTPFALRHFFIALVFQIDAECKEYLVDHLEADTEDHVRPEDLASVVAINQHRRAERDHLTQIRDISDIHLDELEYGSKVDFAEPVLYVKDTRLYEQVADICSKKLAPFYDQLILPLVHLANMGYDYKDYTLKPNLKRLRAPRPFIDWYYVVQNCQLLRHFDLVVDRNRPNDLIKIGTRHTASRSQAKESRQWKLCISNCNIYGAIKIKTDEELWVLQSVQLAKRVDSFYTWIPEDARILGKAYKRKVLETGHKWTESVVKRVGWWQKKPLTSQPKHSTTTTKPINTQTAGDEKI